MIRPDHSATSSSRSVRSRDWNVARSKIEYLPARIAPPRKISTGTKLRNPLKFSAATLSSIFLNTTESEKMNEKSRSTAGYRGNGS